MQNPDAEGPTPSSPPGGSAEFTAEQSHFLFDMGRLMHGSAWPPYCSDLRVWRWGCWRLCGANPLDWT